MPAAMSGPGGTAGPPGPPSAKDAAQPGPSRQADPDPPPAAPAGPCEAADSVEEEDESLLATVGEAELVQMVPCALLDGAELVELHGPGGEGGAGGLYYYASYGGEIDALEPGAAGAGATCLYAASADPSRKPFLDGGQPSPALTANSSAAAAGGIDPATGRPESPEEKKTPKEKTIARVVMAVACTLLTLCIILVGVTLSMSEHINSMVRQIHGSTKAEDNGPPVVTEKNTSSKLPHFEGSR